MNWAAMSATADRLALNYLGSVPVTSGILSGRGFLSQNSELVLDGQVVLIDFLLRVLAATFGNLDYGDIVVVEGREFTVLHKPMRRADGVWVDVPLQPTDRSKLPVPPYGRQVIINGNVD